MTRRQCHECLGYFDPKEGEYFMTCEKCRVDYSDANELQKAEEKYQELLLVWDANPSRENSEKLDRAQDYYDRLRLKEVKA